jgi:hypothetical protein
MIYMITFDLHGTPRRYDEVNAVIARAGTGKFIHSMGSYWFVETTYPLTRWLQGLRDAGDANDEFFVARVHQGEWMGWLLDGPTQAWLVNTGRQW